MHLTGLYLIDMHLAGMHPIGVHPVGIHLLQTYISRRRVSCILIEQATRPAGCWVAGDGNVLALNGSAVRHWIASSIKDD